MSRGLFPPDQDLGRDDVSISSVIEAGHTGNEARRIVQGLRDAYPGPCDVIVLAVPQGKGMPFLEGLRMALHQHGQLVAEQGLDGQEPSA